MNTNMNRMSGGELPEPRRAACLKLRHLIQQDENVVLITALAPISGGRWAYVIQTAYATFPYFVMGTTDDDNQDVIIHYRSNIKDPLIERFSNLTLEVL